MSHKYENKDGKLKITKTISEVEEISLEKLLKMKTTYEADIVHFMAKLAEVDELIAESKKLGITEKQQETGGQNNEETNES